VSSPTRRLTDRLHQTFDTRLTGPSGRSAVDGGCRSPPPSPWGGAVGRSEAARPGSGADLLVDDAHRDRVACEAAARVVPGAGQAPFRGPTIGVVTGRRRLVQPGARHAGGSRTDQLGLAGKTHRRSSRIHPSQGADTGFQTTPKRRSSHPSRLGRPSLVPDLSRRRRPYVAARDRDTPMPTGWHFVSAWRDRGGMEEY
jgi:hypothetical protein